MKVLLPISLLLAVALAAGSATDETPSLAARAKAPKPPKPKPRPAPYPTQKPAPNPTKKPANAGPHILTFDCSVVKETCNTMCYGIKCHKLPSKLTWDKAGKRAEDRRRTSAGCGSTKDPASPPPPAKPIKNNRCSRSPYGAADNCDEYPFASTAEAGRGGQINRCVPVTDNDHQGGALQGLYSANKYCAKQAPCTFTVAFENETPYKYCTGDCKPDGNIFQKYDDLSKKKTKRSLGGEQVGASYLLESGRTIYSPADLPVGAVASRMVRRNDTASGDDLDLGARSLTGGDTALSEYDWVDDKIVRKL